MQKKIHPVRARIVLIGEILLTGGIAGLTAILYHIVMGYAETVRVHILQAVEGNWVLITGWFLALFLMAWTVGKLLVLVPGIAGSGVAQVTDELRNGTDQNWKKVIPARFAGGSLCLLGGLALGRAGPSIHLGAMAGKGVARELGRSETEEKLLITCGAGAGLAGAFHAPLSGIVFTMEKLHRKFSITALVCVTISVLTASILSAGISGLKPLFSFSGIDTIPMNYYGLLLLLGVILGCLGTFYNWFTQKVQSFFRNAGFLNTTAKMAIPFAYAGILGLAAPGHLGSGHLLISNLTSTEIVLKTVLILLIGRFLFTAVCSGSDAPGGRFLPLLALGGLAGGVFATVGARLFGMDLIYLNNFILFAMAGCFSASMGAPFTAFFLVFELTGAVNQTLPLMIISAVSYIASVFLDFIHRTLR